MRRVDERLTKTVPASAVRCPYALARWAPAKTRRPSKFPDGTRRPAELVGGRLVRVAVPCVLRPGHDRAGGGDTDHKTTDGRQWR